MAGDGLFWWLMEGAGTLADSQVESPASSNHSWRLTLGFEFDPYSPTLHEDPYPVYRRLRDEFPVFQNEQLSFWALSRYDDVKAALLDPETYCSSEGITVGLKGLPQAGASTPPLLIMMDGPRHTRMRAIVSRAFTPRRIASLEARIREIAHGLLDAFGGQEEVDLVRGFSAPLPTTVIAELLGVPVSDQEWFKEKSTELAQFDPAKMRVVAGQEPMLTLEPAVELGAYLAERLAERRKAPRDDLLSALLAAEIDGEKLTDVETIGFAFLLLVAGNETTTNLISNAAVNLDRYRDERRKLVADPSLIPLAVEECLRFDSPVQGLARTLSRDVEVLGTPIPKGEQVLLLFASANRDDRRIPDPERFDVTRDPNPHLAFGFGAHYCLGANLARLEARVAFEELLARFPNYSMAETRVERLKSGPVRGALRLPVTLQR
jgi:cytochrome P450